MELEELLNKYQYVSREELEKMQDIYDLDLLELKVEDRNQELEINKIKGREHVEAGPLVEVLSVHFLPYDRHRNKSIKVYGRVYAEFHQINSGEIIIHDLFNRGSDGPEILDSSGGFLTLTGPETKCYPHNLFMPLYETKIFVDVRDEPGKVAVKDNFVLEHATEKGDYEQVNIKYFCGTGGVLSVHYVAMPFAVLCCLEVEFYRRKRDQDKAIIRHVLNVSGKIVARYGNTCGNFASDGCKLFEKQFQESEQVVIDKPNMLGLSRCWLSMPAYSSLILDVDLLAVDTKVRIFQRPVELLPRRNTISEEAFAIDDVVMKVNLICFSCDPGWNRVNNRQLEYESSDDESLSKSRISRICDRHGSVPFGSPAVEVFSVFVGRQQMIKALRLFGTVEVSSGYHHSYIFNTSKDNALELLEHSRTLPIVDDSRVYDDDGSVGIKFNLQDIDGNLFIKGFAEWDVRAREAWPVSRCDNQVCSVIQGQHGFAALHYSFFPLAFHATIEFHYKLRKGGSFGIYGSVIAQYDTYDYSTRHKRDYYRMVLFKRVEQNVVPLKADGKIPISRSMVAVPLDSALIIEVDLVIVRLNGEFLQRLFEVVAIKIGAGLVSMETENLLIDIHVKWKP